MSTSLLIGMIGLFAGLMAFLITYEEYSRHYLERLSAQQFGQYCMSDMALFLLVSAVLIGFVLGRLRLIPVWAAWALALTSPLTILLFPIHNIVFQDILKYLIQSNR